MAENLTDCNGRVIVRTEGFCFSAYCYEGEKSDTQKNVVTVYTKDEYCKRGEYSEEIDVAISGRGMGKVKRIAQAVIDEYYEPGLRIARLEFRGPIY